MSVEVAVICDDCGRLLAASKTAAAARADVRSADPQARVSMRGGTDRCGSCVQDRTREDRHG